MVETAGAALSNCIGVVERGKTPAVGLKINGRRSMRERYLAVIR